MKLILGSQSPQRKTILGFFRIPFEQISSDFPEETVPFAGDPHAYAIAISEGKSLALQYPDPEAIIVTSDCVVFHNGVVYGKPKDPEEGLIMLRTLSGTTHQVVTAVTVRQGDRMISASEESEVELNTLTDEQIREYQQAIHSWDKAGGFSVLNTGSIAVKKINGCFYNVVGLPVNTLRELLMQFGVDVWKYL